MAEPSPQPSSYHHVIVQDVDDRFIAVVELCQQQAARLNDDILLVCVPATIYRGFLAEIRTFHQDATNKIIVVPISKKKGADVKQDALMQALPATAAKDRDAQNFDASRCSVVCWDYKCLSIVNKYLQNQFIVSQCFVVLTEYEWKQKGTRLLRLGSRFLAPQQQPAPLDLNLQSLQQSISWQRSHLIEARGALKGFAIDAMGLLDQCLRGETLGRLTDWAEHGGSTLVLVKRLRSFLNELYRRKMDHFTVVFFESPLRATLVEVPRPSDQEQADAEEKKPSPTQIQYLIRSVKDRDILALEIVKKELEALGIPTATFESWLHPDYAAFLRRTDPSFILAPFNDRLSHIYHNRQYQIENCLQIDFEGLAAWAWTSTAVGSKPKKLVELVEPLRDAINTWGTRTNLQIPSVSYASIPELYVEAIRSVVCESGEESAVLLGQALLAAVVLQRSIDISSRAQQLPQYAPHVIAQFFSQVQGKLAGLVGNFAQDSLLQYLVDGRLFFAVCFELFCNDSICKLKDDGSLDIALSKEDSLEFTKYQADLMIGWSLSAEILYGALEQLRTLCLEINRDIPNQESSNDVIRLKYFNSTLHNMIVDGSVDKLNLQEERKDETALLENQDEEDPMRPLRPFEDKFHFKSMQPLSEELEEREWKVDPIEERRLKDLLERYGKSLKTRPVTIHLSNRSAKYPIEHPILTDEEIEIQFLDFESFDNEQEPLEADECTVFSLFEKACLANDLIRGYQQRGLFSSLDKIQEWIEKIVDVLLRFGLHEVAGHIAAGDPQLLIKIACCGVERRKLDTDLHSIQLEYTKFKTVTEQFPENWALADEKNISFIPDPWQRQLIDLVDKDESIMVVAPTSSGKTFVARYVVDKVLRNTDDGRVLFVLPTNSLCRQVFAELSQYFKVVGTDDKPVESIVGMFTSEQRINVNDFRVLVTNPGSLDVLLFSSTGFNTWKKEIKYLIVDEIHNISTADSSGEAIEHCLSMLSCPVLVLSATVADPHQFAGWLSDFRRAIAEAAKGTELFAKLSQSADVKVVEHNHRHMPLEFRFYAPVEKKQKGKDQHSYLTSLHLCSLFHKESLNVEKIQHLPEMVPTDLMRLVTVASLVAAEKGRESPLEAFQPAKYFAGTTGMISREQFIKYGEEVRNTLVKLIDHVQKDHPDAQFVGAIFERIREEDLAAIQSAAAHLDKEQLEYQQDFDPKANVVPLVNTLLKEDLLPAIAFVFDKNSINKLVKKLIKSGVDVSSSVPEVRQQLEKRVEELANIFPDTDQFVFDAMRLGIGMHYNSLNEDLLLEIECMFREGLVRLVFATSTIAQGVHTPAKTVVMYGDSIYLRPQMMHQCIGRAGRRGEAEKGVVVLAGFSLRQLDRYLLGKLPAIAGSDNVIPSFVLRVLNLDFQVGRRSGDEKLDEEARAVMQAQCKAVFLRRLSQAQEQTSDLQSLLFYRFCIEFLQQQAYLSHDGTVRAFAELPTHVHYERSLFAFVDLIRSGLLHELLTDESKPTPDSYDARIKRFTEVIQYVFNRHVVYADQVSEDKQLFLPDLPQDLQQRNEQFNTQVREVFFQYLVNVAASSKQVEKCSLPVVKGLRASPASTLEFKLASQDAAYDKTLTGILSRKRIKSLLISPFEALNGIVEDDVRHSIEALCAVVPPHIPLFAAQIPAYSLQPSRAKLSNYIYYLLFDEDITANPLDSPLERLEKRYKMRTQHEALRVCKDFAKRVKTASASWQRIIGAEKFGDPLQYALYEITCRVKQRIDGRLVLGRNDKTKLRVARINDRLMRLDLPLLPFDFKDLADVYEALIKLGTEGNIDIIQREGQDSLLQECAELQNELPRPSNFLLMQISGERALLNNGSLISFFENRLFEKHVTRDQVHRPVRDALRHTVWTAMLTFRRTEDAKHAMNCSFISELKNIPGIYRVKANYKFDDSTKTEYVFVSYGHLLNSKGKPPGHMDWREFQESISSSLDQFGPYHLNKARGMDNVYLVRFDTLEAAAKAVASSGVRTPVGMIYPDFARRKEYMQSEVLRIEVEIDEQLDEERFFSSQRIREEFAQYGLVSLLKTVKQQALIELCDERLASMLLHDDDMIEQGFEGKRFQLRYFQDTSPRKVSLSRTITIEWLQNSQFDIEFIHKNLEEAKISKDKYMLLPPKEQNTRTMLFVHRLQDCHLVFSTLTKYGKESKKYEAKYVQTRYDLEEEREKKKQAKAATSEPKERPHRQTQQPIRREKPNTGSKPSRHIEERLSDRKKQTKPVEATAEQQVTVAATQAQTDLSASALEASEATQPTVDDVEVENLGKDAAVSATPITATETTPSQPQQTRSKPLDGEGINGSWRAKKLTDTSSGQPATAATEGRRPSGAFESFGSTPRGRGRGGRGGALASQPGHVANNDPAEQQQQSSMPSRGGASRGRGSSSRTSRGRGGAYRSSYQQQHGDEDMY